MAILQQLGLNEQGKITGGTLMPLANLAINNSFNNLLGYPTRNKQELWPKFISVSGIELARIFDKWKGRTPRVSYKVRDHFDDAM